VLAGAVAKRRFRAEPEEPVEKLTPEQRRDRRTRDRELAKKAKKPPKGPGSPWRRALLLGVPVVVIAAIVALILFTPIFQTPCITFQSIPPSSGVPDFPPKTTTDFAGTWCPTGAALVYHVVDYLTISINGQSVGIPPTSSATATHPDWPSIGRNSSYPGGYECDLPINTRPPVPSAGQPDGSIQITSPWQYSYNLSEFFQVWSFSFPSVFVNSSYANQPIVYQTNDLLGFTSDSTHRVSLFVDGAPSGAGPGLELNTLDYAPNPYPSCLGGKYGTGHVIALSYSSISAAALGKTLPVGGLVTAGPDPMLYLSSHGGLLEKVGDLVGLATDRAHFRSAGLEWLALRPVG
jgi:hypothetical protein